MTDTHKARYKFLSRSWTRTLRNGQAPLLPLGQMTYQLLDEMAANTARLPDFSLSDLPLLLIWEKPTTIFMSASPST